MTIYNWQQLLSIYLAFNLHSTLDKHTLCVLGSIKINMAQIRLTQKQLQSLKLQLYGKASLEERKTPYTLKDSFKSSSGQKDLSISYLKKDVLKIAGFSLIALLAQFVFYLGIKYQLINF